MAYKTLQNPGLYGVGNDYEQDLSYVVTKDEKTGKSTWRDGIYTKLAYDIKDPEGYNKRTVNVPQSAWGDALKADGTPFDTSALSGETDGSALFTSGYGQANVFGYPFKDTETVAPAYYTETPVEKEPQAIDVAEFRPLKLDDSDDRKKAE